MIYRILLLLLAFAPLLPCAFATGLSLQTNGIYLAISGWPPDADGIVTNEPIRFDKLLVFMPFCDTSKVELIYPLDPAYGVKIEMIAPGGKEAPRTTLGKRFGSKFDRLHSITDTRPYPIDAGGSYRDNEGLGGARFFNNYPVGTVQPALTPRDLFEMKAPGVYTLEIQMQMFRFDPKSTNAWNEELIRFSPVRIKVEKPPDAKLGQAPK